jgi:hypothetical protein
MPKPTIHATAKIAWWWKYFVIGMQVAQELTGRRPDPAKVKWWAERALTIEFNDDHRT